MHKDPTDASGMKSEAPFEQSETQAGDVNNAVQPPPLSSLDNAFSSDGSSLMASYAKVLRMWGVKAGKELVGTTDDDCICTTQFRPDGTRMTSANLDGSIQLWGAS